MFSIVGIMWWVQKIKQDSEREVYQEWAKEVFWRRMLKVFEQWLNRNRRLSYMDIPEGVKGTVTESFLRWKCKHQSSTSRRLMWVELRERSGTARLARIRPLISSQAESDTTSVYACCSWPTFMLVNLEYFSSKTDSRSLVTAICIRRLDSKHHVKATGSSNSS